MPNPPFTRLPVTDLASAAAAISDIYDKLNVVAQSQSDQNATSSNPTDQPAASQSAIRTITTSATLQADDQTISAKLKNASSVLLPPTRTLIGKGPYTIQNASTSSGALTLQSSAAELVNGAAATTISMAAGKSITIQPNPGYWIIVNRVP